MRAKKKRRAVGPDIQRNLATYVDAHQRAYAWADKAVAYRRAGKIAQAKAAVKKVQQWLRKIAILKTRVAPRKAGGGRTGAD